MTLAYDPLQAMVMIYSHANVRDQRSVGSEDISGQTDAVAPTDVDAIALPDSLLRSVKLESSQRLKVYRLLKNVRAQKTSVECSSTAPLTDECVQCGDECARHIAQWPGLLAT